ncbi:bifunctional tRNA (5-methylaminomethyl-2-thiouridine)(34)-methyltransferase MnmD/FAD-dependent 5-carboxymethylaminomethyl-2-thiouridine(34) oxidoreductase MnmC [Pseudomonas luteola]|uniref:tRNA 5-methylaminomethyl-2-thiouridine biosynthesis bifunctional protein MnmC n=1 Tax=Pseudomonas luteola TaxID=47886 RepID=A0ABS0MVF7_PSELU|nr:bifunctional tRNA (5-methylaminomethyl-2-thiouridine)(34)-methyltransferase MnmD/FAD-dependent 5-carboxymethylaminomethyl-2-thiouridine(34) oxidoreductase MnmC [Pseudomonas luteola]MBH3440725.1 bifunctional tRNA (5-methylaminomethyl-2-thiouridine)(34)-methyltransferase MnmD/FAD-dependent 5-carboxymethylaminomethyl-2-thiouridine(34) oxidoreductase MnmC [Pseudomonas luteola]
MSDTFHAELDWDDQGQPISRSFGDVYFSKASGLEETRYVFLAQNELPRRFAALHAGEVFTIGETGFGTGLNFLCAWHLFIQTAPAEARLHFVSVEKFPLSASDLKKALALWPELVDYADALLAQYIAVHAGFQRFSLDDGRVTLTLLVGDALDCLPELDARCNAWFLDGFAPAKNPDMWTSALFGQLARLSADDATLATFTCAGFVRRGLLEAGFAMKKVQGFGHKREMLKGSLVAPVPGSVKPWFERPPLHIGPRTAIVIGAGLAGASTAASLATRGWQVTVLERHATSAAEASGNLQGVLYLKLSPHFTPLTRLALSGFGYTRRLLEGLDKTLNWDGCGTIQLATDPAEDKRQQQLAERLPSALLRRVSANEASKLSGIELSQGGVHFPESGWVHPPALCRFLLQHPNITLMTHQEAIRLERHHAQWKVYGNEALLAQASVVVVASATETATLIENAQLPLKRIRGQITHLPATRASQALQCVVCGEGYIAPSRNHLHTLGASFDFKRDDLELCAEEHKGNLALLNALSPVLAKALGAEQLDPATLEGRAAFRCTTPDYLPVVGPIADAAAFAHTYSILGKDARQVPESPVPWLNNLFVNAGHGSRGLITAPLSGELLAAWLNNEPLPLPRAVAEACHPNRFPLRAVIRGQT